MTWVLLGHYCNFKQSNEHELLHKTKLINGIMRFESPWVSLQQFPRCYRSSKFSLTKAMNINCGFQVACSLNDLLSNVRHTSLTLTCPTKCYTLWSKLTFNRDISLSSTFNWELNERLSTLSTIFLKNLDKKRELKAYQRKVFALTFYVALAYKKT